MAESKTNIIQKQVLNLRYKGKADGFALQKEITDWYYRELFPELQAMIDRLAPEHIHVRLDKLELDLVIEKTTDWKLVLRKQAIEKLDKKIQSEIYFNSQVEQVIKTDAADNFFEVLKYYLQKGMLPWWSPVKSKNEFEEELEKWLLDSNRENFIGGIKETLKEKEAVYRAAVLFWDRNFYRFVQFVSGSQQLADDFKELKQDIVLVAALLPASKKKELDLLVRQVVLEKMATPNFDIETITTVFAERCVVQFSNEIKNIDLSVIVSKELKQAFVNTGRIELSSNSPEVYKQVNKKTGEGIADDVINEKFAEDKNEKDVIVPGKTKVGTGENEVLPENSKEILQAGQLNSDEKDKERLDRQKQKKFLAELKEGVFVHNAGLVIVASFLPMFFKKLLLVEGDEIIDKSKAVMLVQFLASGKENVAEFELGLAKILCGLELDTPVDTTIVLTDAEKDEVNELLLSVIEYWSILKNTSVDGLRDSFLIREGKLSFDKNEWLLQVEQKPYDMLLQNLPWNISMIKLQWMESMLKTEWFN